MRVSFFGKQIKMLRKSPWNADLIIFPIFTDYIRSIWEKLPDMRRVKIIKIQKQIRHRPFSGWHVRIKAGCFVLMCRLFI